MNNDLVSLSTESLAAFFPHEMDFESTDALRAAVESLRRREGLGAEMMGWCDLPHRRGEEFDRLRECAAQLREEVEILIVVGIGGSYLGARALHEALEYGLDQGPRLVFAGHHLEAHAYSRLLEEIEGREVAVNVISKSGTTTEPAIAFRLLKQKLESMYGPEKAARRIVATTDARRGALRTLADQKGYRSFVVPEDVGGRFSVLSPVGLLPLAAAGVDVERLLEGAAVEADRCMGAAVEMIPAAEYAFCRHDLYLRGFTTEILAGFHPSLHHLAEWWKQLFGESEGKQGRGIFPAAVDYTTDLHSLGQFLQDGRRNLFETFLQIQAPPAGPRIPTDESDLDGLNYLAGRRLAEINSLALDAVMDAHVEGGVPSLVIRVPELSAFALGSLIFFFEFAVSLGGRLLEVNPFDQPGVEAYKSNLFRLLGKPGHD